MKSKLIKKTKKKKLPKATKSKKQESLREIVENSIQTPII